MTTAGDKPTAQDIALVRDSLTRVAPVAQGAVDLFYRHLFVIAPELRSLFPADLAAQKCRIAVMLGTVVRSRDDTETLLADLRLLGARHLGYGVTAAHYLVFGETLLWTLQRVLGDRFTPAMRSAWVKVYRLIAATMQTGAADAAMRKAA